MNEGENTVLEARVRELFAAGGGDPAQKIFINGDALVDLGGGNFVYKVNVRIPDKPQKNHMHDDRTYNRLLHINGLNPFPDMRYNIKDCFNREFKVPFEPDGSVRFPYFILNSYLNHVVGKVRDGDLLHDFNLLYTSSDPSRPKIIILDNAYASIKSSGHRDAKAFIANFPSTETLAIANDKGAFKVQLPSSIKAGASGVIFVMNGHYIILSTYREDAVQADVTPASTASVPVTDLEQAAAIPLPEDAVPVSVPDTKQIFIPKRQDYFPGLAELYSSDLYGTLEMIPEVTIKGVKVNTGGQIYVPNTIASFVLGESAEACGISDVKTSTLAYNHLHEHSLLLTNQKNLDTLASLKSAGELPAFFEFLHSENISFRLTGSSYKMGARIGSEISAPGNLYVHNLGFAFLLSKYK